jgi:hypothetical protein
MAIFYLNVTTVSRSVGRNAVVAAAYCSRSQLCDRRRETLADFSEVADIEHSEILLPESARAEWSDRATLWNEVESVEKRDDAQVAREIEIAIPVELSRVGGIELTREFFNEQFVARGIIVDLNIHRASGADGVQRSYVQGLFSMREIVEDGFGKKRTDWKDSKLLSKWRERWTLLSNKYLLAAGCNQLIRAGADAVRGRALEPSFESGVTERRAENLEIAWRNGERVLGEPELALRALTNAGATFSRRDLIEFVSKNTAGKVQFDMALARVECSIELVRLSNDESFSTRSLVATVQCASGESRDVAVATAGCATAETGRTLAEAISQWERAGLRLRGVGLTYETAKAFEKRSGIKSVGVHGLLGRWKKKQDHLASTDVLVVNDARSLSVRQKEWMLLATRAARSKLALVDGPHVLEIDGGATGLSPEEVAVMSG